MDSSSAIEGLSTNGFHALQLIFLGLSPVNYEMQLKPT